MDVAGISPEKVEMGRLGAGVGVRVPGGVLGVLSDVSSHNTGTTREPHDIPRISYLNLITSTIFGRRPLQTYGGGQGLFGLTEPYPLLPICRFNLTSTGNINRV